MGSPSELSPVLRVLCGIGCIFALIMLIYLIFWVPPSQVEHAILAQSYIIPIVVWMMFWGTLVASVWWQRRRAVECAVVMGVIAYATLHDMLGAAIVLFVLGAWMSLELGLTILLRK